MALSKKLPTVRPRTSTGDFVHAIGPANGAETDVVVPVAASPDDFDQDRYHVEVRDGARPVRLAVVQTGAAGVYTVWYECGDLPSNTDQTQQAVASDPVTVRPPDRPPVSLMVTPVAARARPAVKAVRRVAAAAGVARAAEETVRLRVVSGLRDPAAGEQTRTLER